MKKKFALLLAVFLLGSTVLASCAPGVGSSEYPSDSPSEYPSDSPISLNMTGKEAAELLLSQ